MLEGKCPKCGARYYGWALNSPRNQMCENCGIGLEILDGEGNSFTGYSPFTAAEYKFGTSLVNPQAKTVKER
jgi:hypothetical protein